MRLLYRTLSRMIDESTSDNENLSICMQMIVMQTFADKLWFPFRQIVFHPLNTLLITIVLYVILCIIYLPLFLLSLIVSSTGSLLLFAIFIVYGLRSLATMLVFPGSSVSVQKDISQDFLRRLTTQIENVSIMSANTSATLLVICSGKMNVDEACFDRKVLNSLTNMIDLFQRISNWLSNCKTKLEQDLTVEDMEILKQLTDNVTDLTEALTIMSPIFSHLTSRNYSLPLHDDKFKNSLLSCLHASETLKTVSAAIRPKKKEDKNPVQAILGLLHFRQGPKGLELLSFLIMREQLVTAYGGEFVSIPGSSGNTIDAVIIPSAARFRNSRTRQDNKSSPVSMTTMGTVLFCNPNAGYFECLANCPKDSSWLGFYVQLGFDVCLFNYRGYLRSKGCPTPEGIKADGETVAKYLRNVRGVSKLVVHGESIGGMVACHIAKVMDVQLLVVDRSFASLHSLSGRLVGGWAEFGLHWLTRWDTNVVVDFTLARCPKIILQDPNDEIIIDGASLKTGVATSRVLGDVSWHRRFLAREYAIADALEQPTPHVGAESILANARVISAHNGLSEAFMQHLYACLLEIARRVGMTARTRREHDADDDDDENGSGDCEESINSPSSIGSRNADSYGSLSSDGTNSTKCSSSGRVGHGAGVGRGTGYAPLHGDSDAESGVELTEVAVGTGSGISRSRSRHISLTKRRDVSALRLLQKACSSKDEWLHTFCSLDVTSNCHTGVQLSVLEKVWVVLGRTDGGCGELLGQAVAKGYDGVRNWACCFLVWSTRSTPDVLLPRSRTDLKQTISSLRELMNNPTNELDDDPTLKFIIDGLEVLLLRLEATTHLVGTMDSQMHLSDIGSLIPLHCGHNGWPGSSPIGSMIRLLTSAHILE